MGQLRFCVHNRERLEDVLLLSRIYVAGADEFPWATRARWRDDQLLVERGVDDSGYVYVPWEVEGHGRHLLGTATLMERDRPYQLEVELARGLIQRIRSRLFIWEWLGLRTPPDASQRLRDATKEFARAATRQGDPAAAASHADAALATGLSASNELVAAYSQQTLAGRQRQTPLSMMLGVTLGMQTPPVEMRRQLLNACNLIQLSMSWRAIEASEGRHDFKVTDEQLAWCQTAGLKVAAGPLLQMDDRGVPDWMYLWDGEDDNLIRLLLEHVRAVASRYSGRVHLWHVASRVNNGILMSLSEESRLNLVAQAVQLVRQIDARTPIVVSFDQPWGEYLANADRDLAPIQYADALVRADVGLSGLGLEINAGYWPGGAPHRPAFEYGRLIDQWSQLGLPLMVSVTAPSSAANDARSNRSASPEPLETQNATQADAQLAWAASALPLLMARTTVQVLLWNQLSDETPHEFPNSGLFDAAGVAKPTLSLLSDLRKSCLT